MALVLPKFRWLVIGAVAAGVWAVHEDMKGPRPPESVQKQKSERTAQSKLKPSKPVSAKPAAAKPVAQQTAERPIPPEPVGGKPAASAKTVLALPKAVEPPPAKPQKIVTGSIARPDKPTYMQTKAKVRLRAQARPDADVIATLEPRTVMRELARSGEWRLVMGDGRKGWVRADFLAEATYWPRRPKLPVAEARRAQAVAAQDKQQ